MTDSLEKSSGSILTGYSPPLLIPRNTVTWLIFVLLNLGLYVFACGLWQILCSESDQPFWEASLRSNLLFEIRPLSFSMRTLSIQNDPWMIPVVASLLALLIFVPVVMAVMYQLVLALAFVVILAVVGLSPELSVILVVGCLLASRTRMRRKYPFYAILYGYMPVVVYLIIVFLLTRLRNELLLVHQWVLVVPYLLAVALAVAAGALTVLMARLTKFRPGIIWPATLVLLSLSGGLLFNKVGRDELKYAQISGLVGDDNSPLDPLNGGYIKGTESAEAVLLAMREELVKQCEDFFEDYPQSHRAPSVMLVHSLTTSIQLDRRNSFGLMTRYTPKWPLQQSLQPLRQLVREFPDSPQAALAMGRIGMIELRKAAATEDAGTLARIRRACDLLQEAEERLRDTLAGWKTGNGNGVFVPFPSIPKDKDYFVETLFEIEKLNWLIRENQVRQNRLSAVTLARMVSINPCRSDYYFRLKILLNTEECEKSPLKNNITLAWARQLDTLSRARILMQLAMAETQDADAAIEANYELGGLAVNPDIEDILEGRGAVDFYGKVRAASENPWHPRVEEFFSHQESPPATTPTKTGT